jgi:phage shock protein PspC (stress-responsive transcriptional regulator)
MKKTVSINISGIIFNLDEDAYEILKDYLQKLNRHFSKSEEGLEVIQDIEARIAELFQEKISESKEVINIEDVNEVIEKMGSPADFAEELDEEEPQKETQSEPGKARRKYYRDSDNKVLGGVCSGLAAFLDVDVLLVRVISFILLIFSAPISVIIYIVLWIVIPEAITTAQKLEMRGEKVTVSNIEKTIKDEFENVKDNFNKFKSSKGADRAKEAGNQFVNALVEILRFGLKAFIIILGIVLIFTGVFSLLGLLGAFFFNTSLMPIFSFGHLHYDFPGIFNLFASSTSVNLFSIGFLSVVVIPLIVIAYAGLKLLIRFKSNDKVFLLTLLFGWIFGLLLMIGSILFEGKNFTTKETVKEKFEISSEFSTLKLDMNVMSFNEYNSSIINDDDYIIINEDDSETELYIKPKLDIQKSYSTNYEIVIIKSARGNGRKNAADNAKSINYSWSQSDSSIYFGNYYSITEGAKWRAPQLKIVFKVPEGRKIYISEELEELLYDIENVDHLWDFEMGDKTYEMLPQGLKQLK